MKIILTGPGFIGNEVLAELLTHPSITSILVLSRKPLQTTHPKLTHLLHEDFTSYPPEVMARFTTADACIWCLGIANPKSQEQGKVINYEYPLAGARAMKTATEGKSFRFVYLSGMYVEKDQDANLWILGWSRKMRGLTELEVLGVGKEEEGGFKTYVARPGFVTARKKRVMDYLMGTVVNSIGVQRLSRALIRVAEKGGRSVWEMDELVDLGNEVRSENFFSED